LTVIAATITSQAAILFLTSPNNPTGNILPREHLVVLLVLFTEPDTLKLPFPTPFSLGGGY